MEDILLIGSGGHARSVVDAIEAQKKYRIIGFSDRSGNSSADYRRYGIVCNDEELGSIYEKGVKYAFVTIGFMGNSDVRNRLYKRLKAIGFEIPLIIDPSAVIASDVQIGEGTFVGKRAVINSNAVLGKMCIVNTGAIIEHDCNIGDFTHIAVGAVLCGQCNVGSNSFVGANATIIQSRTVGDGSIIGAGCVIKKNIAGETIYKNIGFMD